MKLFTFLFIFLNVLQTVIDGSHLGQHEGLLKTRQVFLGSTIPVSASQILHVGLGAIINNVIFTLHLQ